MAQQEDGELVSKRPAITFADLKIQTKRRGPQPFIPNAIQVAYLDEIWPEWRSYSGGPMPRGCQEIILKSRQFGFSTLIATIFFLDTVNTPGTTTVVVAHKGSAAENLFQIVHRFWRYLPEDKRPYKRYSSKTELFFEQIDSRYLVFAAGGESAAASYTIQNLHCSEAALYPPSDFWTTTIPAVPEGHGNIFIESTARGESGRGATYCQMYREAKGVIEPPEGETRLPYTARFYAWWEHEEYEVIPIDRFERSIDETTLANKYDLDGKFGKARADAKLNWRRITRSKPGMGNLFAQEYPGDDVEAFLVSGSRFFLDWDDKVHVVGAPEVVIEDYYEAIGAYDWGYGKPACFLLGRIDDRGRIVVTDEIYSTRKTDPEQALDVFNLLKARGLDPRKVTIWSDPAMWAKKADNLGKIFQNVQEFRKLGLRMVPASNDRVPGWTNVRRYLHARDQDARQTPFLRVLDGCCPNLVRTMPLMIHDDKKVEDADTTIEDHAPDTLRYMLAVRPAPVVQPTLIYGPQQAKPLKDSELPHALRTEGDSAGFTE